MQNHVFTISKVCQQFGIEHAIICPGSRSAPLVYAFTQNAKIKCHSVIDERSAGFVALGIAQQLQKPVVLISTSGTACLNFFPAIAEAWYQRIPLLVLTADRPPELLNQQDGQMIMQKGVFGKHVRASHELLCFDEENIDYKLTERIVFGALAETLSDHGYGPVHINVPLREPLYNVPENPSIPKLSYKKDNNLLEGVTYLPQLDIFSKAWGKSKKRLILIGQMPVSINLSNLLNSFINQDDVLLLCDIVSNQHERCNAALFDSLLQFTPKEIFEDLEPDLILSIGGPFVSKSLKLWLKSLKPEFHFRLQPQAEGIDTYQNVTHLLHAEFLPYLEAIVSLRIFKGHLQKPYLDRWKLMNKKTAEVLQNHFKQAAWCEPLAVKKILQQLPDNSMLQLGNSSSVRWVSWLGAPLKGLQIFSNRGTSGIDGSVSTAIGAAKAAAHKTITLILGDLSLYYDQNAFWQNTLPANLKIIVLNNQGGNIFNWIEGPSNHKEELTYFTTPHTLRIQKLCDQYGLTYLHCQHSEDLTHKLKALYEKQSGPVVLELSFDPTENADGIQAFRNIRIH